MRRPSIPLLVAGSLVMAAMPTSSLAVAEAEVSPAAHAPTDAMSTPAWVAGIATRSALGRTQPLEMRASTPDPSQDVTFYWGLKRPEARATRAALAAATPGSRKYRHFRGRKSIRNRFGAKKKTIRAINGALEGAGVSIQRDGTGVFARARGTVAAFQTLLGVSLVEVVAPGVTVIGPAVDPALPTALQGLVTETIWLSIRQNDLGTQSSHRDSRPRFVATPTNRGTPIRTCSEFRETSDGQTFQQAAVMYGAAKLQRRVPTRGDIAGFDPRVGIVSMGEGFSAAAAARAAGCFRWSAGSVTTTTGDGQTAPLGEGLEGDLDVQMVGSIMASAREIDYFESMDVTGPAQVIPIAAAFNTASPPDVLSISYGWCEPFLQTVGAQGAVGIANSIYARLALAGTSVFVAAGDSGSDGCLRTVGSAYGQSVMFPSTSPWVTAVGGTRVVLTGGNARRREVVWNDSNFIGGPLDPTNNTIAGGGGRSVIFGRPRWQKRSVTGVRKQRAVPDISAHASAGPAWIVNAFGDWYLVGGTSASAPLVASSIALVNAHERMSGRPPLGFLNPWLYSIRKPRGTALFDVVSGGNDLTGNGCCSATRGFDLASGLGAPNFASMRARIAAPG